MDGRWKCDSLRLCSEQHNVLSYEATEQYVPDANNQNRQLAFAAQKTTKRAG